MAKLSLPHLSRKVLLILGMISVLVIAIPVTVFLVQQQQEVRSRAEKATILSLTPATVSKKVGDEVSLDVMINPGVNQVNFINLVVNYDSTKLEADKDNPNLFVLNPSSNLTILDGPNVDSNTLSITLSEEDATKPIVQPIKIGTINLTAFAPTDTTDTKVTFDETQTVVRSLGATDPSNTSVLSSTNRASVEITGAEVSPTPTTAPSTSPTPTVSPTPTTAPSTSPTVSPTATPKTSPSPTANPTAASGSAPTCSGLTLEGENQGDAPFAVTLTATGDDSDGTITKVTFNFGDGNIEDVTDSGGLGSESINAQVTHTYHEPGTFTASAVLTDDKNNTSSTDSCKQQITVNGTTTSPTPTPTPIPPTGPSATVIVVGVLGIVLTALGAMLFLVL